MLKHGLCLDTKGVPDTSGDGKEEWDTCLVTWNNTRVSQSNSNSINLYSNMKNQASNIGIKCTTYCQERINHTQNKCTP